MKPTTVLGTVAATLAIGIASATLGVLLRQETRSVMPPAAAAQDRLQPGQQATTPPSEGGPRNGRKAWDTARAFRAPASVPPSRLVVRESNQARESAPIGPPEHVPLESLSNEALLALAMDSLRSGKPDGGVQCEFLRRVQSMAWEDLLDLVENQPSSPILDLCFDRIETSHAAASPGARAGTSWETRDIFAKAQTVPVLWRVVSNDKHTLGSRLRAAEILAKTGEDRVEAFANGIVRSGEHRSLRYSAYHILAYCEGPDELARRIDEEQDEDLKRDLLRWLPEVRRCRWVYDYHYQRECPAGQAIPKESMPPAPVGPPSPSPDDDLEK